MDGLMLRLARVVAEQYLGVMVTPVPDSRAVSEALSNYVASETVRALRPREVAEGSEQAYFQRKHGADLDPQASPSPDATTPATAATTPTPQAGNSTCNCKQYEVSITSSTGVLLYRQ